MPGLIHDVNAEAGGGVTTTRVETHSFLGLFKRKSIAAVRVTISDDPYSGIQDQIGNPLGDNPADILVHELVGHEIPIAVGSDTGNAVDNENKVRAQEGKGEDAQRAKEATHKE